MSVWILITLIASHSLFLSIGIMLDYIFLRKVQIEWLRKIEVRVNSRLNSRFRSEKELTIDEKVIYENLIVYLESKKPYLNPDLVLADIARALHTNRSYLSSSIKNQNGGNFRSLINSYRVKYAIETFNKNMDLRVSELARLSGFNSSSAFNLVFKAMVNQTPGEWCQGCKLKNVKKREDRPSEVTSGIPQ